MEDFAVDEVIPGGFSGAQVEYGSLDFSYLEGLDRGGRQPRISECPQDFLVVVRGYLRGIRAENRFKMICEDDSFLGITLCPFAAGCPQGGNRCLRAFQSPCSFP